MKKDLRVVTRMWLLGKCLLVFLLLLGLASGCAGPKRLPPLDHSGSLGGGQPSTLLPELLAVGLLEGQADLSLGTTGPALILGSDSARSLGRVDSSSGGLVCRRQGDQVWWEGAGRSGLEGSLRLQPVDPSHRVTHGDQQYRGEFLVIPTPGGSGLTLINSLDIESYLRGVVPWEIGRHTQEKLAALQAQAVAARTYTISHLGARGSQGFDVYASVMDQVYRGSKDEDELCNQAVDETRGLILSYSGQPISAYYSACCGGTSSKIDEIWPYPAEGYLNSRPDSPKPGAKPFCAEYRYFDWRETWTAGQLEEILQETLPQYLDYMGEAPRSEWAGKLFTPASGGADQGRPGHLLDLEIKSYTTSGRVARLDIKTEAGMYHVRGDRTRWVMKPPGGKPAIMRSARFEVELTRRQGKLTEIATRGRGYGHGMGLCQSGALVMAERGYTFEQILAHYYSGAKLGKSAWGR